MKILERSLLALVVAAVPAACSSPSPATDAGTDIGHDAARSDAIVDTGNGTDAVTDAGSDVATDVAIDAPVDTVDDVPGDTGPTCTQPVQVLVVAAADWVPAAQALNNNAIPCADYWISVAPQAADATMLRGTIEASSVRDVGLHTHALAVFDWAAWSATNPNDWNATGISFRRMFDAADYNALDGDTWLVVNVPVATLATSVGRQSLTNLLQGLYNGPMGSSTLQGGVVLTGPSESDTTANLTAYRTAAEAMLTDATFWTTMATTTRWLGAVVPPDPTAVCVAGASLTNVASTVNAYAENLPRLANATGAPTTVIAAQTYLAHAYVPILSAAWDPATFRAASMASLVDTEVFSTLTWAEGHGYPAGRIGFGFAPPSTGTMADETTVLTTMSASVAAGYAPGTVSAAAACVPVGTASCGCTVSGAAFLSTWSTDDMW